MRGPWARRLRDVLGLHLSDLGGDEAVSEAERSIVRRAAVLTVELERIEAKFAVGEAAPTDLDLYQRTAGNLRRLLEAVGLERRPRDVGTSLGALMVADIEERRLEAAAAARASARGENAEAPATALPDATESESHDSPNGEVAP